MIPAAMCVLAARASSHHPGASRLMGLAMLAWGAGFAVYFLVYEQSRSMPSPSIVDALWFGWYVLVFVALLLKAGRFLPARKGLLALHLLVGTLTVTAAMGTLLAGPILRVARGDTSLAMTALAYPAMDIMLIGLVVAVVASTGWRLNLRWVVILGALLAQAIGDSVFAWELAAGTWAWGGPLEAIWPAVQLALAVALWPPAARDQRMTREANFGLAMPLGFAMFAIALLAVGNVTAVAPVVILLASAALVTSAVLVVLSTRELERLRREAQLDPLTGLASHGRFHQALATEGRRAEAQGEGLVLLLGDVDGFKSVNRRVGRVGGDVVLRRIAEVLRGSFGLDLVARLGGDEFAVLLAGSDLEQAEQRAGRAAVEIACLGEGLGMSWGFATLEVDGPSPELMFLRADLALQEAKRARAGLSRHTAASAGDVGGRQRAADARGLGVGYAPSHATSELETSREATILALSAAIEAKDGPTGAHIQRVRDLGLLLVESVCPEDRHDPELVYGFLLHDIGKLVVPDAVLTKPGKLDADEWELMRTHSQAGVRILAPVLFLGRALDVVLHHHERWDGAGYPNRLAGEEIPLWARVFAVVDSVDAMTADRPYRRGLSYEAAVAEVLANAGTQFDPACAYAFAALPRERVVPLLEQRSPPRPPSDGPLSGVKVAEPTRAGAG